MSEEEILQVLANACSFVRDHGACDLRCMDGRGRCSNNLLHAQLDIRDQSGLWIDREELRSMWIKEAE